MSWPSYEEVVSLLGGSWNTSANQQAAMEANRGYTASDLAAGTPVGYSNGTNSGTWAGVQRSQEPFWTSRIQISGEAIQNSREQQGAFIRAMEQEYANMRNDVQREFLRATGIGDLYYGKWFGDPDMEMDVGL